MSTVTNMILSFSNIEDEEARMEEVEAFSEDTMWTAVDTTYGRGMEMPVFLLAANGWDLKGFGLHLRKVKWEEPQSVRLFVCLQDEDAFHQIHLPPVLISPKDRRWAVAVAYMRTAVESQLDSPRPGDVRDQHARIKKWAEASGVTVEYWFEDTGTSGLKLAEKRDQFRWAMNAMSWNRVGLFVVASRDRLARDPVAFQAAIETVEQHGGKVVVVDEQPAKGEFVSMLIDEARLAARIRQE